MHIALTGASGFIGSAALRHLKEAGHTVTALVRSTSRRDHIDQFVDRYVEGDQDDERAWPDLLEGADCVIHNSVDWPALRDGDLERHCRSNLMGSIRLLEAAAPRQFVFLSTIAVHHDMRPRWGGLIDEDHPLRPSNLYGAYKAAVEAHLWAAHFGRGQHTCALRPCGVYGIDPNLERSYAYKIVKQLQHSKRINLSGGGKFVHVEDVAAAIVATIGNPDAAGRAYNLVDCYARWADLAAMAARYMELDTEIDMSSPSEPKNVFGKEAANGLGIALDRGHEGLGAHMAELVRAMSTRQEAD